VRVQISFILTKKRGISFDQDQKFTDLPCATKHKYGT